MGEHRATPVAPRFIDRSCNRLVEFAGWNFGYAIEDVVFGGSLIRVNGPGQEDRAETRPSSVSIAFVRAAIFQGY